MAKVNLDSPLSLALGKSAVARLKEHDFRTVRDLLYYAPKRYYSWGKLTNIGWLTEGSEATLLVKVVTANLVANRSGQGHRFVVLVTDGQQNLTLTFFAKNQYMLKPHQRLLKPGVTALVSGKVGEYRGELQMVQPEFEELEDTSPEAVARRAGRPIPIYRAIGKLPSWKVAALVTAVLEQLDDASVPEIIPKEVRTRFSLAAAAKALRQLHNPDKTVDWEIAKRTLAWQEALTLETALLSGRLTPDGHLARKAHPLPAPVPDEDAAGDAPPSPASDDLTSALQAGLPFQLTDSQKDAWAEISENLGRTEPMQRLLQADVGAGKTVVALLAMLRAVQGGWQAALLAPTEVLARQHYSSLTALLDGAGVGVPVHLLTGKRPGEERDAALAALGSGEPGIVVGTHALIQDGVDIPGLALLVVDEQHRFGVAQREKLREGRDHTPHLLVMTATPIPRTIAMTVFGDLDVTLMKGMPPGRRPIQTHLVSNRNAAWMNRIWERTREEVEAGGRVYVVCPRIDVKEDEGGEAGGVDADVPAATEVAEALREMVALRGISIALAHGRQRPEENARAFRDFASGKAPVLVATTVVEVGVDVPEATLMVVLGAQRFGLSQLHQLRGRVGRSERQSMCILVSAPTENPVTAERLQAIAKTTDGFALAEVDLRLRSEGDVLGQAQSGRLSGLRFLSVRKDGGIIASARAVAEEILHDDPGLSEHPQLRDQVEASVGEDVVWLERN